MKTSVFLTIIGQFLLVISVAFLPPGVTAVICHYLVGVGLIFAASVTLSFAGSLFLAFWLAAHLGD